MPKAQAHKSVVVVGVNYRDAMYTVTLDEPHVEVKKDDVEQKVLPLGVVQIVNLALEEATRRFAVFGMDVNAVDWEDV